MAAGAAPGVADNLGVSALRVAATQGFREIVSLLVKAGATLPDSDAKVTRVDASPLSILYCEGVVLL